MTRVLGAIVGGVVLAVVLLTFGEAVGKFLFPLSPTFGLQPDPKRVAELSPPELLITVLLTGAVAAFAGASLAARIAGAGPWPAWVVAGLFLLAEILHLITAPHPVWFVLLTVVLTGFSGFAAGRLFGGPTRAPA